MAASFNAAGKEQISLVQQLVENIFTYKCIEECWYSKTRGIAIICSQSGVVHSDSWKISVVSRPWTGQTITGATRADLT